MVQKEQNSKIFLIYPKKLKNKYVSISQFQKLNPNIMSFLKSSCACKKCFDTNHDHQQIKMLFDGFIIDCTTTGFATCPCHKKEVCCICYNDHIMNSYMSYKSYTKRIKKTIKILKKEKVQHNTLLISIPESAENQLLKNRIRIKLFFTDKNLISKKSKLNKLKEKNKKLLNKINIMMEMC
jgi:hypothetical protein